ERKMELLGEYRASLINQAVTKGLDADVEMKPSGVDWIGEIPKHWTISKVKHELESLDYLRVPLNSETRGSLKSKVYDYYGASGVIDKVETYIFDEPLILIGEDGANLYLRSTPLAFKATGKYWVNNHAHVLRPKYGNIDYLTNMLESLDYTHYISGAAQPKLTAGRLMNIVVVIPPLSEQNQIADFINRKAKQIDELRSNEEGAIKLLKEYRQSLISEVVTGKIDVRGEA
ncbi:MAG: restriction endonuclease subunit S, partial [Candidatus Poribacteria bacterium]|nr:restriction endonuclease subunit S [Candidatus Poribacteria bacterium]